MGGRANKHWKIQFAVWRGFANPRAIGGPVEPILRALRDLVVQTVMRLGVGGWKPGNVPLVFRTCGRRVDALSNQRETCRKPWLASRRPARFWVDAGRGGVSDGRRHVSSRCSRRHRHSRGEDERTCGSPAWVSPQELRGGDAASPADRSSRSRAKGTDASSAPDERRHTRSGPSTGQQAVILEQRKDLPGEFGDRGRRERERVNPAEVTLPAKGLGAPRI